MAGITLDMFNFKLPLPLEPEKNWRNADNDDDDDVVDSRCGLTDTGWAQLSLIIYAARSVDCVYTGQPTANKKKQTI